MRKGGRELAVSTLGSQDTWEGCKLLPYLAHLGLLYASQASQLWDTTVLQQ